MTKKWKTIMSLALFLVVVSLCCTACSVLKGINQIVHSLDLSQSYESKETKLYNNAVDEFFAALDQRDADAIRAMFSKSVRDNDTDLDEQIKKLMEVYPGPTDINKRDGSLLAGRYSNHYGKHTSIISSSFPVVSNETYFWCHFEITYQCDEDESRIGVTQVLFFTAEERCIAEYDDDWKRPDTTGLTVYSERTLDCEVRCIEGHPYQYTLADSPLNAEEVKDFLNASDSYTDFVEHFGEPNAVEGYYIYELSEENGNPRYLKMIVLEESDEVYDANVVDDFDWLYTLWKN